MPDQTRSKPYHDRSKPVYKSPTDAGAAVTAVPPFSFHGVTARVFPLASNISSLTSFCDSYLNMDIPKEIVHFKPVIPYVYLVILDYGDMSVDVGQRFWVSQREVSFAVPLERYKEVDGKLVFQDLALVHPFIYVDDQWSLMTGREVYGWPKVLATMEADVNEWTKDPRSPTKLLTMSTSVFPEAYSNKEMAKRTLLEVYSEPDLSFSEMPFDTLNPLNPFEALQNAITSSITATQYAAEFLLRLNIRGFEPTHSLGVLQDMFGYGLDLAQGVLPEMILAELGSNGAGGSKSTDPKVMVNNVNLKQFRDAANPTIPCYQELNYSVMGVNRVNRAGLLGDLRIVRGDMTGGYRVAIHQYASQPVVEALGLEVEETLGQGGVNRAVLKPILPFWCDVEFHYGRGEPLCWRTAKTHEVKKGGDSNDGDAIEPEGPDASGNAEAQGDATASGAATTEEEATGIDEPDGKPNVKASNWHRNRRADAIVSDPPAGDDKWPPDYAVYLDEGEWGAIHAELEKGEQVLYNATRGAALQAVPGPFDYPDVTARVFPLLANRGKLQALCESYLNSALEHSAGLSFEPFGSYVYLTATNYGNKYGAMWSETNNIGSWKEREVSFQVPVKWYMKDQDGVKRLVGAAMLSPFAFANTSTHVASDREISGNRTEKAKIESPSGGWMSESGPVAAQTLLSLSTELLPALGTGQKAIDRTLLEIVTNDVLPSTDNVGWRHVSEKWGKTLARELERKTDLRENRDDKDFKDLKALTLGLLVSGTPFHEVVLRQLRDSSDPLHACFQALLLERSTIRDVYDIQEIEERVHVAIHAYPSHPIVEALGLCTKKVDATGDSIVQFLQPIRPFWMRLAMRKELAKNVCRREGALWEEPKPNLALLVGLGSEDQERGSDPGLEAMRKRLDCLKDRSQRQRLRDHRDTLPVPDRAEVIGALESVSKRSDGTVEDPIEPQMIIESILSEEWEHWGEPRGWRRYKGEPELVVKPDFCIPSDSIGDLMGGENRNWREREKLVHIAKGENWLVRGPRGKITPIEVDPEKRKEAGCDDDRELFQLPENPPPPARHCTCDDCFKLEAIPVSGCQCPVCTAHEGSERPVDGCECRRCREGRKRAKRKS